MSKPKSVFERYIEAMEKTGDAMLSWQYQKSMYKQSLMEREERDALVKDVAGEVLSRLSATVDISEIMLEIEELRKAIEDLGK